MQQFKFPKDFYFGGATAAYQCEGATKEDGKGEVIWDKYLREQGTINPDPACDFYHRYPEDLDLCKKFHINAIRVSIDWARIFPEGEGKIEPRGVEYYHKLFKKCREDGVEPFVTLHHFDTPQALQDNGGWLSQEMLDAFVEYAKFCFKEYADEVMKALPENSAKNIVVWNPGCGKGYESFSLACILKKRYPGAKIRVYGHDTDLLSVSNAPLMNLTDEASTSWYQPYTTRTASGDYTFSKEIKDSIMFEYHDCVNTNNLPPIDIVFSRDLLSFLPESSQNTVLNEFNEKLKGNGIIIVGENENIDGLGLKKSEGNVTLYSKE